MNTDTLEQSIPAQAGYAPLPHKHVVRISGPGTDKFVQGQFSQNVEEVTSSQSLRAAACTPKGRAYLLTRLVRDGDDLLMDVEDDLADEALGQLKKYLMLFRGTTMETEPGARIIGVIGEQAAAEIAGEPARSLTSAGQVAATDNGYLVRLEDLPGEIPRFEFWQTGDQPPALEGPEPLTAEQWQAASIAAGVPWLTPATVQAYVPQMLNLQHLQGVHFKKGCYTGQEVVARMHFLGQLKKSLFRLDFSGARQAPTPGSKLLADGKAVGEVVNSVMTTADQGTLLAVIRHNAAAKALQLEADTAVALKPVALPYAVPEREDSEPENTQADSENR